MLEITDLHVSYGDAKALKGVSIRVSEGGIAALVGSNGAGKSTALMTIAGLVRPGSGRLDFLGKNLGQLSPAQIVEQGISLVPEGRWLFTKMTIDENLELGAYPQRARGKKNETRDYLLGLFPELRGRLRASAGTLSGGQQQMLAIGRALMSSPRLLMLDEPSLGLAPLVVKTLFEVIAKLNAQGVTILLVEQNVLQCLRMARTGFVIKNGTITLSGPGPQLLEDPGVQKAFLGIGRGLL